MGTITVKLVVEAPDPILRYILLLESLYTDDPSRASLAAKIVTGEVEAATDVTVVVDDAGRLSTSTTDQVT